MSYSITIKPDNCSGCMRCQLACAELYTGLFSLEKARIRVDLDADTCSITFEDDCTRCGVCADHCLYGALIKVPCRKEDSR